MRKVDRVAQTGDVLNQTRQGNRHAGIAGGCVEVLSFGRAVVIDLNMECVFCVADGALEADDEVELAGRCDLEA